MIVDKYCTADQAVADPIATKDKIILSNGDYAQLESRDELRKEIASLRLSLSRIRI